MRKESVFWAQPALTKFSSPKSFVGSIYLLMPNNFFYICFMKKLKATTSAALNCIICFFILNSINAQVPKIKWWYNTFDFSAGQSAAKDIDGDGKLEVVFGCYRNDSFCLCFKRRERNTTLEIQHQRSWKSWLQ